MRRFYQGTIAAALLLAMIPASLAADDRNAVRARRREDADTKPPHELWCPSLAGTGAVITVVTQDEINRLAGAPHYGGSVKGLARWGRKPCEIFVTWEGLHNGTTVAHELCHCRRGNWHPSHLSPGGAGSPRQTPQAKR